MSSCASTDSAMLRAVATKRPARRQVSRFTGPSASDLSAQASRGEYNIWYDKPTKRQQRTPARTRVNVALDSGTTAGNSDPNAFICALFAKGCCHNGENCTFLHRIPLVEDLARLSVTHDIFGRERHATNRTDMSGVGTWARDQRTLYIGKLSPSTSDESIRRCFSEFGAVESTRVFAARGFAFVTFVHRGAAEFAYMAMMDQSLGHSPMINVRWAEDDKNPRVAKRKASEVAFAVERRVQQRQSLSGVAQYAGRVDTNIAMQNDDAGVEARLNALRTDGATISETVRISNSFTISNAPANDTDNLESYPDTDDQYTHAANNGDTSVGHQPAAAAALSVPSAGFNVAASVAAHLEKAKNVFSSSGDALAGLGEYESSSDEDDGKQ